MDTTYAKAVALAVPVFVFLILVEIVADRVRRTHYYRLADAINSLSCGIVSTGMRVFFGFLGLFFYEWVLNHFAVGHLPANRWGPGFSRLFCMIFVTTGTTAGVIPSGCSGRPMSSIIKAKNST